MKTFSLYEKNDGPLTKEGARLAKETSKLLTPLVARWEKKGALLRDVEGVISRELRCHVILEILLRQSRAAESRRRNKR